MIPLNKAFAEDMIPSDSLRLVTVRGALAHADFTIPDQDLESMPGLVRVITAQDIPGQPLVGVIVKDQPVLAINRIRYLGEPIALIVAESSANAKNALSHFQVNYEELCPVFSVNSALSDDAPCVHQSGNLVATRQIHRGDINSAFESADVIVEGDYQVGWLEHGYLETEVGFATVNGGYVEIYYPTQCPHYARSVIASVLALEKELVRVIPTDPGGGFGGKLEVIPMCHLAIAAFLCDQTVSLVYSRQESMSYSVKSHPITAKCKTAATSDGTLLAAKVSFQLDTGAYASYGPGVLTRTAIHAVGPYHVPNVEIEGQLVYTNNPVAGAMRGFGVGQIAFAYESQMALIANRLQMDPFEIRYKNALDRNDKTVTGQRLDSYVGLKCCIKSAKKLSRRFALLSTKKTNIVYGKGVAAFFYGVGNTGHANPATVSIEINSALNVLVRTSLINMGQNPGPSIAKVVAQELGIPIELVKLMPVDTAETPNSGMTSASRSIFYVGSAAREAAAKLRDLILREARTITQMDGLSLDWRFLTIVEEVTKRNVLTLSALLQHLEAEGKTLSASATFCPQVTSLDPNNGTGSPYAAYSFGCHVAEVSIDLESYEVRVTRYCAISDSGTIIDLPSATGQILGGIVMGIGMALTERLAVKNGQVISDSFKTYRIPNIDDIPKNVTVHFVDSFDSSGPFGAKGLGEPAVVPVAAAVVNAINDALCARISKLPVLPEDVWKAIG